MLAFETCTAPHSIPALAPVLDLSARREVFVVELGVAVRQDGGILMGPGGVEAHEDALKVGAAYGGGTGYAANEVKAPVQVDHHPPPSGLMQSVHVLQPLASNRANARCAALGAGGTSPPQASRVAAFSSTR